MNTLIGQEAKSFLEAAKASVRPAPTVAELKGEEKPSIPVFIPEPKRTRQERRERRAEWWERFKNTNMRVGPMSLLKHAFLHKKPEAVAEKNIKVDTKGRVWETNYFNGQGQLSIEAATKSEARARLKERLGVERLPAGTILKLAE